MPEKQKSVAPEREYINRIKNDFPILKQKIYGNKPLVYLDSAATAQKPVRVIEAINNYYGSDNANVHRGIYTLADRATRAFEETREKVRKFINAGDKKEIVFTSGTTDAINLVALTWGRKHLTGSDAILITEMEHHSNLVPWQMLAEETGAELLFIPFDEQADLDMKKYSELLSPKVKLVAVTHMSNVFGTINPVKEIIEKAHANGSAVLVDGAQASAHLAVDVRALDVDFYALSGHKMMGPTGIGALYAKKSILEEMPPLRGGGEMIGTVTTDYFTTADLPYKFEAGTPNIAGAIGWGAALDYLGEIGLDVVAGQEKELVNFVIPVLENIPGVKIIGNPKKRGGIISFVYEGAHPHDLAQLMDRYGIAMRSGHHCAQPALSKMGLDATARISFYVYNTYEDAEFFLDALNKVIKFF